MNVFVKINILKNKYISLFLYKKLQINEKGECEMS